MRRDAGAYLALGALHCEVTRPLSNDREIRDSDRGLARMLLVMAWWPVTPTGRPFVSASVCRPAMAVPAFRILDLVDTHFELTLIRAALRSAVPTLAPACCPAPSYLRPAALPCPGARPGRGAWDLDLIYSLRWRLTCADARCVAGRPACVPRSLAAYGVDLRAAGGLSRQLRTWHGPWTCARPGAWRCLAHAGTQPKSGAKSGKQLVKNLEETPPFGLYEEGITAGV